MSHESKPTMPRFEFQRNSAVGWARVQPTARLDLARDNDRFVTSTLPRRAASTLHCAIHCTFGCQSEKAVHFSGHCYIKDSSGICAPDSPINGTIAAGSDCQANHECFSNFCFDGVCASESQAPGFVAGGGFCSANNQCYSGVCYKGRCGAESEELGRSAAGSWCNADKQCYSRKCKSNRCGADSPVPGVVPSGGHCNAGKEQLKKCLIKIILINF